MGLHRFFGVEGLTRQVADRRADIPERLKVMRVVLSEAAPHAALVFGA